MVVGNGLIASKFLSFETNSEVIIFASGVSNSNEINDQFFQKEKELIYNFHSTEKKFVYFSSLLIEYPCMKNKRYVKHKKEIEEIIGKNFKNYVIFRLPNVVGKSKNKHTFFNFFLEKILKGEELFIEKKSTRFFLDSDDLEKLISPIILDKSINRMTINVCLNNKISIIDFVELMCESLNKNIKIIELDSGCDTSFVNTFPNYIEDKSNTINYNKTLVQKYCDVGNK